jgi:hypothetical protein
VFSSIHFYEVYLSITITLFSMTEQNDDTFVALQLRAQRQDRMTENKDRRKMVEGKMQWFECAIK